MGLIKSTITLNLDGGTLSGDLMVIDQDNRVYYTGLGDASTLEQVLVGSGQITGSIDGTDLSFNPLNGNVFTVVGVGGKANIDSTFTGAMKAQITNSTTGTGDVLLTSSNIVDVDNAKSLSVITAHELEP